MDADTPADVLAAAAMLADGRGREVFAEHVPPVLAAVSPTGEEHERTLSLLRAFALKLQELEVELWSALRFSVRAIADVAKGDPVAFADALAALEGLVVARAAEDDVITTLQRGVPGLAAAAGSRAWALSDGLRLAAAMAGRGISPVETLHFGLPGALQAAEGNRDAWGRLLPALAGFIDALERLSVEPVRPVMEAVAAVGEARRGDAEGFAADLEAMVELAAALRAAGIAPYGPIGSGVAHAMAVCVGWPGGRDAIVPLAIALASHGHDPGPALSPGFAAIAALPPELRDEALAAARAIADDGLDPGMLLSVALPYVAGASGGTVAGLHEALVASHAVLAAMARAGIGRDHVFAHGVPALLHHREPSLAELQALLAFAADVAAAGIDPGPVLEYGVAPALAHLPTGSSLLADVLAAGRAQAALGIAPIRTLGYGVAALLRAAGDDAAKARRLIAHLQRSLLALHERGMDVSWPLGSAVDHLARIERASETQLAEYFDGLIGFADSLASGGFDAAAGAARGLHQVAEHAARAPGTLPLVLAFVRALSQAGIEPTSALATVVPTATGLVRGDPERLAPLLDEVLRTLVATGRDDAAVMAEAAAIAIAGCSGVEAAAVVLAHARSVRAAGGDGAGALRDAGGLGPLPAAALAALLPALESFRTAGAKRAAALHASIPSLARLLARGAAPLDGVLAALARASDAWPETSAASTVASTASAAAAEVARDAGDAARVIDGLAELARRRPLDAAPDPAFPEAAAAAAAIARDDGAIAVELAELLLAGTGSWPAPLRATGLAHLRLVPAEAAASGEQLRARLGELEALRAATRDALPDACAELERLLPLAQRLRASWTRLIAPLIRSQGGATPRALAAVRELQLAIDDDRALDLLRRLVTQEGTRAVDLIGSFLVPATAMRAIVSLGGEAETILRFLRDVPVHDWQYYSEYRDITEDAALSPPERRARIASLSDDLEVLTGAVIAGALTDEQERHRLLPVVLFQVFPPANGVGRGTYLRLLRTFPDRDAQLEPLRALGEPDGGVPVARGRAAPAIDVSTVDAGPWQPLREAVLAAETDDRDEAVAALGEALFDAWIEARLAHAETRPALLRGICRMHRRGGGALPADLADGRALRAYHGFLADTVPSLIETALHAHRAADPDRYERRARARLAPRAGIGRGLARAVRATVAAFVDGSVPRDEAAGRLRRQLQGFALDDAAVAALLEGGGGLENLLEALAPAPADARLGDEHQRLHGELVGGDLAAMRRELARAGAGALASARGADEGALELRFVVSKRRVHSPIGFCEGVCTATDLELWNDPRFAQAIAWGPGRRALGGMHLLVVGGFDRPRHLVLPGINPALSLIDDVGAPAALDAFLAYALRLAAAWRLAGVWIPNNHAICSNRGSIREELTRRALPQLDVPSTRFSYHPYAYTFESVWVVPP